MKKLTNFVLEVSDLGVPLDDVAHARFVFVQGSARFLMDYPGSRVVRNGSSLLLRWTIADTVPFSAKQPINLDAFIKLRGSDLNPCTESTQVWMTDTYFRREEVESVEDNSSEGDSSPA